MSNVPHHTPSNATMANYKEEARGALAEFIATMFFVFFGVGCDAQMWLFEAWRKGGWRLIFTSRFDVPPSNPNGCCASFVPPPPYLTPPYQRMPLLGALVV